MRADLHGGRPLNAPPILNPAAFCRLLAEQAFPDLGFLEIVSARYAPWADPDFLVHLTLRHQVSRQPVTQTVVVRHCGDDAETVFRAARELWARVFCRSETLGMALPLGTLPGRGLMLQVMPAGASLSDLLQDRRDSQFHAGVRTWARWLARLHGAKQGCEALPIRLESDLREELADARTAILHAAPAVRAPLDRLVGDLHLSLAASPNPLLPTLGLTDPARLRFHEDVLSPIDLHAAALGDPAADVGRASADLELAVLQAVGSQDTADQVVAAFTSEYRRHGGADPVVRSAAYRACRQVLQIRDALAEGRVETQQISLWLAKAQALLVRPFR